MPLPSTSTPTASQRLQALIEAEVGPEPKSSRRRSSSVSEPRGTKPLAAPLVDEELWIKTADPSTLGPLPIATRPWGHQIRAYHWALPKKAAYLDFGLGAGKSLITVALAAGREHKRVLVICPKSVVPGWPRQFRTHGVHDPIAVALDKGTMLKRIAAATKTLALAESMDRQAVIVTNYEAIPQPAMQAFIRSAGFDFVVLDEAHKSKAPTGLISKTIHQLFRKSDVYKLMLSGTPLPHSALDAFAQMRILDERVLGTSWTRFRLRYSIPDPVFPGSVSRFAADPWINKEELAARLAPFFFRVGREVLDLPPAHHVVLDAVLGPKARSLYQALETDFYAEIDSGAVTAANALTRLIRLSQAASGFTRTDDGDIVDIDSAKRDILADTLDALPPREPVVVFARFTHDLATIRETAESQGRRYGEVSGQRNDLVDSQYPEDVDVLGVQIAAGGAGIDLSRAAICIYWGLSWSLGEYDQSLARVHRPGQEKAVTYFHIVTQGTVDQRIYRALESRREVVTAVMERMS